MSGGGGGGGLLPDALLEKLNELGQNEALQTLYDTRYGTPSYSEKKVSIANNASEQNVFNTVDGNGYFTLLFDCDKITYSSLAITNTNNKTSVKGILKFKKDGTVENAIYTGANYLNDVAFLVITLEGQGMSGYKNVNYTLYGGGTK
jgi:hypothetical protein